MKGLFGLLQFACCDENFSRENLRIISIVVVGAYSEESVERSFEAITTLQFLMIRRWKPYVMVHSPKLFRDGVAACIDPAPSGG